MPALTQSQRDTAQLFFLGIHIQKSSATIPQTTTQHLFTVAGGRVLITLLFGEVTTIFQNSDPVLKVTSTPTTGTAVDVASTVDTTSLEAGGLLTVEGDGTALIKNNAGAGLPASGIGHWICPIGSIDLISGASKTGATKWDVFYFPIDDGAYIVSA
jgi:hypothetical protein